MSQNRRDHVDAIVKNLVQEKVDVPTVIATLMNDFRVLDNKSETEREVLKNVLASNVLLAKAVGELTTEVAKQRRELNLLKSRR